MYLGGYATEVCCSLACRAACAFVTSQPLCNVHTGCAQAAAAHAYDIAALSYWGSDAVLNFPGEPAYNALQEKLCSMTREEVVGMLKRNSTGFSRGRSRYRGVTRALFSPVHVRSGPNQ